jgi:hypothetical protein
MGGRNEGAQAAHPDDTLVCVCVLYVLQYTGSVLLPSNTTKLCKCCQINTLLAGQSSRSSIDLFPPTGVLACTGVKRSVHICGLATDPDPPVSHIKCFCNLSYYKILLTIISRADKPMLEFQVHAHPHLRILTRYIFRPLYRMALQTLRRTLNPVLLQGEPGNDTSGQPALRLFGFYQPARICHRTQVGSLLALHG